MIQIFPEDIGSSDLRTTCSALSLKELTASSLHRECKVSHGCLTNSIYLDSTLLFNLLNCVGKVNLFTFKVINSQTSFEALTPAPPNLLHFGHELKGYKTYPLCEDFTPLLFFLSALARASAW